MEPRSPLAGLAAVLAALATLPGLALVWLGGRAFAESGDDMLLLVMAFVGLAGMGAGLFVVAAAVTVATRLARRRPGARIAGVALGGVGAMFGFLIRGIGGPWPWVATAWGAALVVLLLTPSAGRDLGPLVEMPRRR